MQHPNFETRHPLQTDEQQETGFDPLHNFNKNRSSMSALITLHTVCVNAKVGFSRMKEWDDLFLNSNYLARIRQAGINGRLRSSRFRSVCWKLYLEALPEDKEQWINKTKELRAQYEKIKEMHITNPRKAAGQQDLVVNNPLSQDEGSLWNKFFQDKELKGMIKQDVLRTRWVRLLFGREFPLQDLLVVWDALFADSITLDLVDYIFVAMLLYIRDALIASNFQTCLGLLMHYPPIGDINSLLQKALFLRDPKNNPRPVNYQFQQNLDYYNTRGADLMNKTRSGSITKAAPLNINKVSSSLLNFGRKLISPAMSSGSGGVSSANNEVYSSSSSSSSTSPASAPVPTLAHPLAEPPSGHAPAQTHSHAQTQHHRLLKSESMPVHLSKGQSSRTVSSSPSIESLSGGRVQSTASPPLPPSRGSDVSTSSPPLSATKKESFFNITRSRSHSKTMGKKEMEEDLEAQISFLQGQINDLEAMSKYCAKMMNTHICKIQEVILQEHLQKEDEVLVSLAGLKQIKDILKGALRFNQSQLEAEENEEITIADDHYTSTAAAEGCLSCAQVASSLCSDGKNWDDYILVSQDGDLQAAEGGAAGGRAAAERTPPIRRGRGLVRMEPEGAPGTFHDPLMAGTTSGSSSPDDGSTHSKDSDFTIVNPNDL
uniref:Rab-GAP TBC domain-containing protein n=1 Tax=Anabas testudineus TaxID=64144 RepID=A0A7N6BTW2_ANATE